MKRQIISGLIILIVAVAFYSCKDNSAEAQRRLELETLDKFIKQHYPDSIPKPSGLYFIEETKGTGDSIKYGDRVQVYYATWALNTSLDSTLIDESVGYLSGQRYYPLEFIAGTTDVIQGLSEGITYMSPGSIAHMVIPSELAYGQNGSYNVASFTTLLMIVEVYKVFPAQTTN